jgi:multiple sugar transport system permease protein
MATRITQAESTQPAEQPSRWMAWSYTLSEKGVLLLFLLPALAVLLVAQGYPLIYSLYLSFVDFALAKSPTPGGFVGLANYAKAFQDPVFQQAMRTSVIFAIAATTFEVGLGLLLAYLVVGESLPTRITRTILIMPMVIAPVAVGTMWRMLLNSQAGLVNYSLGLIGIPAPDWLAAPTTALIALIWVDIWEWTPFAMLIFVAALTSMPTTPQRAAEVDGASRWQIFRFIVFPMLIPVIMLVIMFRLIDTLMVLDIVYSLSYGGPGFSTHTISFWIYQQGLKYFNISYAAAMAWILLLLSVLVALVLVVIRNIWLNRRFGRT